MSTTVTEIDPATLDEAAATLVKKHKKDVQQIIQWEQEADSLTGEADSFRLQAAGVIVKLLDGGATERAVAQAIGKSDSHVHHSKVAWTLIQDDTTIPDFLTAYKLAKKPPAQRTPEAAASSNSDSSSNQDESAEVAFPPWAKQMRQLKALSAEMVDQANFKQVGALVKALENSLRQAVSKQDDMKFEADTAAAAANAEAES